MRWAWRSTDIRTAENGCLPTLPEGGLMARAAAGLARRCAQTLVDRFGGCYGRTVLVLAGTGNNGGDALYAGAWLARRGVAVSVLALGRDVHGGGLAAVLAAGGRVVSAVPARVDLVIDGIVGIGARGGLRPAAGAAVAAVFEAVARDGDRPTVVAADVPSGIDVDSGAGSGLAVMADITVTFGALKPGLLVGTGAVNSGVVELVDIGLTPWLRSAPALGVPDMADIASWWRVARSADDKYSRGVVGIATGSAGYSGAAVLSVAGASAGPAGMVRYAGAAADLVRAAYPAVVAADRVGDAGRVQAWAAGSGLGTDDRAVAELRTVLAAPVPVCLDADAINLLVDGTFSGLLRERSAPLVLTPHDGEFTRLAGGPPGPDRVESALRLAAKTRAVVVLKGCRTVVATPSGQAFVNPTGTPALATAGSGDVLTGLLGSLLATGLSPERAALAATYLHGLAGDIAAEAGPVTAVEVAASLRTAVARVLASSVPSGRVRRR
jgi:hydroxyethylthiazole kinase-like uncharacterized protein yjeF